VCLGAAHVDRIARAEPPYRTGASNPGRLGEQAGGAALNAARAFARWGCDVALMSGRGGDASALLVESELAAEGVEDLCITWLDRAGASYTALLDDGGELVAGVADMAIYDLMTPRVLRRRHLLQTLREADGLLVDANLPAATLEALAVLAPSVPLAAIAVSPAKVVRLRGVLPDLHVLFASRREAARLAGLADDTSPADSCRALGDLGLRRAVVTDGPHGVTVLGGGELHVVSPPSVDAVRDVTGAGDTLAAITFAASLEGTALPKAVRLGTAASALHISSGLPTKGALDACFALASRSPAPISLL